MLDLQSRESIVKLFDNVEEFLPSGVDLFHLNDSKTPFGSRVDRHQCLGQGFIWSQSDAGIKTLLNYSTEKRIDVILETPDPARDLKLLL